MFEIIGLNECKHYLKYTNVIIYGTVRDIEQDFIKSFANIDLLSSFFNNVYIIIFENDSLDNTRKLLTNWASNFNINIIKHLIFENNLNIHFPQKMHRIAYCRNKILNYIFDNNLDKQYQYAIHCNFDASFWSLNFDSICNCFQYDLNLWDAMFPININYTYYDYSALRCDETWFNKNIYSCERINNEYKTHITDFYTFLQIYKDKLIPVNSAFNGIGIYKLSSLNNCRYNASYNCNKCKGQYFGCLEVNCHIGLHKSMISNNCKLFINTKMFLESKNNYMNYTIFLKNIKSIPNIQFDPLKYVLSKNIIDQNQLWLNFSINIGIYENIISNFTKNNITTFSIYEKDRYLNSFINNNVNIYIGHLSKNIYNFILNNESSFISFIHIDFNNYHYTKNMFEKLYKKINNNCIIVINKFINFTNYLLNDLHAFYEFTQKYNINFEYIGINGVFCTDLVNTNTNDTIVAIKIKNNPYLSKINITNNFENEDIYISFDWTNYIHNNKDLIRINTKQDAWNHFIYYGKNEKREHFIKTDCFIKPFLFDISNNVNYDDSDDEIHFVDDVDDVDDVNDVDDVDDVNDVDIIDSLFVWKYYIEKYPDLKHMQTPEEAWQHWINHGKNEGRSYIQNYMHLQNLNWIKYIESYDDLKHMQTSEEALEHWVSHGKNEGRKMYTITD